jgi:hypothetical protein
MTVCRNLAADISAGRLSREELDDLMKELETAKASAKLDEVESKVLERGRVIAEESALAAMIEKRNRLQNIVIENKLWSMVSEANDRFDDPSLGVQAALVNVNAPIAGNLRSVDALTQGIFNGYVGGMIADLKRLGLLSQFNTMKGDFSRQVSRALHDLNRAVPEGVDVPKEAMQIAKVMQKYQRASVERQNRAGAYIRQRDGYVVRQSHDPARMAGKADAWKAEVRNRLDFAAMDVADDRIEDFLQSAYEAITSGVRLTNEVTDISRAFTGPGNMAKKVSASRTLIFKSADDWFDYDQKFGKASLRESFMQDLQGAAQSTALMTNFGTNPQAMMDKVIQRAEREWRNDPKKLGKLRGGVVNLQAAMDEVTGDVNIGATTTTAQVMSGFRALQTMAKLGGAWISALSDVAFSATNRVYQGRNIMDAWGDALKAPMEGMSRGQQREFADLTGTGIEGQMGDFMSRYNAADGVPGQTSKMMALFFKLNLLGPWTDANKRGITLIVSRDLAMNAAKSFDALPDDMRRMLASYGIDARKWEVARGAVRKGQDGREYMLPGDVDQVRGAVFTGLTEGQQIRLRDEVRESLFTLLSQEADFAVPSAGARERAIMRRGYRPGTVAGEAVRFVGQFKSFGVTSLTKVLGRQVYGRGAKTLRQQLQMGIGANMGLVNSIVGATVLGYFIMQAKELMKGRDMRPNDSKAFIAAMMQGGGLGIYGDFLFGEASRFGGGTLQTVMGPGIGTVADAIDLLQRGRGVVTGGDEDLRGDVLQLVKSNIPFANLFYVKGAMDYLIWYQMQEMINPGYLRRMERRVQRENNQTYWMPPSSIVATGGGFR